MNYTANQNSTIGQGRSLGVAARGPVAGRVRVAASPRHRPLLDAQLGLLLWKDRRVPVVTKLLALALGSAGMAGVIALAYVMARAMILPSAPVGLAVHTFPMCAGALLFGTIALLRLAPAGIINLIRLERVGVIPLRHKPRD